MQAVFQKISAFFISIVMAFLSVFGVSFEHKAENVTPLYVSPAVSPGGNEKTDGLTALYRAVKAHVPNVTPCPEKDPYPDDGRIAAIYYEGETCQGETPRVFAYIGFPENASPENQAPAMVLVHGGGAHAWASWVRYWVDQGYAAISMDCFGQGYTGRDHTYSDDIAYWAVDPASHLPMDNFASRELPFEEQWFYFFIADIILGHNVLRADPRVDVSRVGLTGISWGGFASSVAVCYDDRFAFAAPVYGSGFQDVSRTVWGQVFRGDGVSNVWDAKLLLPEVQTPVMWFNGDNDPFFSADSTTASAAAAPNGALTYIPSFPHGMYQAIELPELLRFANAQTGMGEGNIQIETVSYNDTRAVVTFSLPEDVKSPRLYIYYRSTPLEYTENELTDPWQCKKGITLGNQGSVRIPEGTTQFFILIEGKTRGLSDRQTLHASSGIFTVE